MAMEPQQPIASSRKSSRLSMSNLPPRELWVGLIGLPVVGVAIGAFNYFNLKQSFKSSIKQQFQKGYEKQALLYSRVHQKPREDLTLNEYASFADKHKCLQESNVVETRQDFIKNARHGWTVAGMITGFAGTSIALGLMMPVVPALAAITMPSVAFIGLVASVGALVAGVASHFISGAIVANDADRIIADGLDSAKNKQGIDRVEQHAKQQAHDIQKERLANKIKQKETRRNKHVSHTKLEHGEQKNSFVQREIERRELMKGAEIQGVR